jgi:hypothetical protein
MKNLNRITVQEIIWAFFNGKQLLKSQYIKDYVHNERNNGHLGYKNRYTFNNTIQKIIEIYCPDCEGYIGIPIFQKVKRGYYCLHKDYKISKSIWQRVIA